MKEARYFYVVDPSSGELPDEEAQHAVRVLRLSAGDELFLIDGRGSFYEARVTMVDKRPPRCFYTIEKTLPQQKSWQGRVTLAIAPTKMMERMEWMVEKAVEVGVDEIDFLRCQFSERTQIRIDRLERIAISAMKQSRKPWLTDVRPLTDYGRFIVTHSTGRRFIAHCYPEFPREDLFSALTQLKPDEDVTLLVGPEGDFSADEVKAAVSRGFTPVTLGESRLRTETAGLMAVAMAQIAKAHQSISNHVDVK